MQNWNDVGISYHAARTAMFGGQLIACFEEAGLSTSRLMWEATAGGHACLPDRLGIREDHCPNPRLRPSHVWAMRGKLDLEERTRDLANVQSRH
jgi:hypothetical protein